MPHLFRQAIKKLMTAALPESRFRTHQRSGRKALFLTFDDGPHPLHTPRVLDLLARYDAKATFFVIGEKASAYPEIIRRMEAEGHLVGNHTYEHLKAGEVPTREYLRSVQKTDAVLVKILGKSDRLFRPPHGKLTAPILFSLWSSGYRVVLWNKDPKDFSKSSTDQLVSWSEQESFSDGDILLLHDVVEVCADALPQIIDRAGGLGLRPVRLSV